MRAGLAIGAVLAPAWITGLALAGEAETLRWFSDPVAEYLALGPRDDARKTALDSVHDLVDGASKLVMAEAPPWLRRTTLDWSVPETGRPTLKLFSVQPLVGGGIAGRALLFQGHALSKEANTRGHLGLRYLRFLDGDRWRLGANLFYDHERSGPSQHQRLSVGTEARASFLDVTANYYTALLRAEADGPRALSGYDLTLGWQIPHLSWARVEAMGEVWRAPDGGFHRFDQAIGLTLDPWPFLHVAGSIAREVDERPDIRLRLELTLPFGVPPDATTRSPLLTDGGPAVRQATSRPKAPAVCTAECLF